MYKRLVRTLYFIINPFRKLYWFIFRPKTKGVRCIIEHDERFLLVRLGYDHKIWTIPGGGVKKHETDEQAIRREVFEEVGIRLGKIIKINEYINTLEYKRDTVIVFNSSVLSPDFVIDGIEIIEAKWFLPQEFPNNCVSLVRNLFDFYSQIKLKPV